MCSYLGARASCPHLVMKGFILNRHKHYRTGVIHQPRAVMDEATAGRETMANRPKHLEEICRRFGVAILYVFGSCADQVADWLEDRRCCLNIQNSDVDLGVVPEPGTRPNVKQKVLLTIAIEDFLRISRVDLVSVPEADPFLAANIIRGHRLYCRDPHAADEYDLFILRRAGDLIPLERERLALILGSES